MSSDIKFYKQNEFRIADEDIAVTESDDGFTITAYVEVAKYELGRIYLKFYFDFEDDEEEPLARIICPTEFEDWIYLENFKGNEYPIVFLNSIDKKLNNANCRKAIEQVVVNKSYSKFKNIVEKGIHYV